MKKTIYFTSPTVSSSQIESGIVVATEKRDNWLTQNSKNIVRIDNEDIKFIQFSNLQHVVVVILLTYYPK